MRYSAALAALVMIGCAAKAPAAPREEEYALPAAPRAFFRAAPAPCAKPWVFFDLGANTLISTPENSKTGDLENLKYMPGAREYLADLSAKGYSLGLLVNWPPGWGGVDGLKKYIAQRWIDSAAMDWTVFNAGVRVSETAAERKPNPPLFDEAVRKAGAAGCPAVYETAIPEEIPAAKKAGMIPFHTGDPGQPFYLPEETLQTLAAHQ